MKEIWKPVVGYEGLYEVSNLGRIKSLKRYVNHVGGYRVVNERILKQILSNTGYFVVSLWKNNNCKSHQIHVLVADAFLKRNPKDTCVNHKDGNKQNNNVDNLEWCTYQKNNIHAIQTRLKDPYKKVNQYDLDGNFIKTWNSIKDAEIFYKTTHISECCNDKSKRNKTKGYLWRYADK